MAGVAGIGVHNLADGLAVGGTYAVGEITLGALLLIGLNMHNTSERVKRLGAILACAAALSVSAQESDQRRASGIHYNFFFIEGSYKHDPGVAWPVCVPDFRNDRFQAFAQTALVSGADGNTLATEAEPEFSVDRPDVSESSFTVPSGFWQAELGLRMNRQRGPHATVYFSDDLFRIGVRRDVELRIGGGGLAYRREQGSGFAGLAPFYAGLKYHFLDEEDHLPSMAVLLNANLPSPSHRFSSGQVDGNVLLAANKTWGPIELEPNIGPGAAWDPDARAYFPQFVHATTLSYYPVKSLRFYVELFGTLPGAKNGDPATSTGLGVHWYNFRKNIAVDLSATRGLSRLARDSNEWSVSVGFSFLR